MSGRLLRRLAVFAAAWTLSLGTAFAQAPVLSAPSVANTVAPFTVTFSWTATSNATGYRFDAGVTSGSYIYSQNVGNVTTFTLTNAVPTGAFAVRIVAQTPAGDVPSNEVIFQAPAPPAAPTGFVVARNGTGLVATWMPGVGGSTVTGYRLQIGLSSGTTIYSQDVTGNGWGFPAGVPANTYYLRAVALSGATASAPSNEVVVDMPVGGACDAAPPSGFRGLSVSGLVLFSWPSLPGVTSSLLDASLNGAPVLGGLNVAGSTRLATAAPIATYGMTHRIRLSCGSAEGATQFTLVNDGSAPPGPRTPDPAPGQLLPIPGYASSVVNSLANSRPDLVFASCRETGGNNRFMFEVVRELRKRDTRWGLNWKRGNVGDVSQDIVAYNRSALPDEGATTGPAASQLDISIFDMIGGHCGPRPGPNWEDVTGKTIDPGRTKAVWTLLPYIQAGYTP